MNEQAILSFLRSMMLAAAAGAVAGACIALTLLVASCTGPGTDEWETRCRANGGHVMRQHIYKGSVYLCLTPDGRIIELPE